MSASICWGAGDVGLKELVALAMTFGQPLDV